MENDDSHDLVLLWNHSDCFYFLVGVAAFSAGGFLQTCALLKFGGVYCWGNNDFGQLGTGDTILRLNPTSVIGLAKGEMDRHQRYTCDISKIES